MLANVSISGIYGGGPIYKDGAMTIPNLQDSGFVEIIVWNLAINGTGDLNFNYEFPLIQNGKYIGGVTHPDFQQNMAALKCAPSSVKRLTFSIGSSNMGVFQAIQELVDSQGTGPASILHRNFMALKSALPDLDALDFDDENCYDTNSMTAFAIMLGEIGFEVTLSPYTQNDFWADVVSKVNGQRPGTITAVHLQCYSGGSVNSPCSGWNLGNVPVYPGLSASECSANEVMNTMSNWGQICGITGGFIWDYDYFYPDKLQDVAAYASALNRIPD